MAPLVEVGSAMEIVDFFDGLFFDYATKEGTPLPDSPEIFPFFAFVVEK